MLTAAALASASYVIGLYLSYYLGIASGAAIVLTATIQFLVVLMLRPGRIRRNVLIKGAS